METRTMNYQTLLNYATDMASDACEWLFSDPANLVCVVAALAITGAINGVRLSLGRCSHTGHCGRRVL